MKKYYLALMVVLMTLVSVGFAACGDEPKVADIVGTWQYDDPEMFGDFAMLFQFTKEGVFHQVIISINPYGKTDYFAFHGSYTVKRNKLYLTYDYDDDYDGEDEPLTIEYMVQGDRLTFLDQEYSTFTRVMSSVIEPYL